MRELNSTQSSVNSQNGGYTVAALWLELSNGQSLRAAAAEITDTAGNFWNSSLRGQSSERRSLRKIADKVEAQIQNVDRLLGQTALNTQALAAAVAHYGKLFVTDGGTASFKETFTGEVVNARVRNGAVSLEMVSDLATAGGIAAWRTLQKPCAWGYKDEHCGSLSPTPTCSKQYEGENSCATKTPAAGVAGATNQPRFSGFLFRQQLLASQNAGGGGNADGGGVRTVSGGCFMPDAPVTLASGRELAIERCRPGTRVAAFDSRTGKLVAAKVKHLLIYRSREHYEIDFSDGVTVECTWQHPFYLANGQYRTAENLFEGHRVQVLNFYSTLATSRLGTATVTAKRLVRQPSIVYNLEIPGPNTFFAWRRAVHNSKLEPTDVNYARHANPAFALF